MENLIAGISVIVFLADRKGVAVSLCYFEWDYVNEGKIYVIQIKRGNRRFVKTSIIYFQCIFLELIATSVTPPIRTQIFSLL